MTTNYNDNEATQYNDPENEATEFEESTSTAWDDDNEELSTPTPAAAPVASSPKKTIRNAAIGGATGVLIGGTAAVLMGLRSKPEPEKQQENGENDNTQEPETTPWVDDQIAVATTVTDDMSFGEAFAAARQEVGPGGAFEWRGGVYGTYTAAEWNSMSAEEQAQYQEHFNWNHLDASQSDLAQHDNTGSAHGATTATDNSDDIEVVSVDRPEGNGMPENPGSEQDIAAHDPEIEILGVVHDSETGANVGQLTVDGQEVIVVDIDGDLTFDYIATDQNGDGVISENEIAELTGQDLTVNDLGGFTDPAAGSLASTDPIADDSMIYEG